MEKDRNTRLVALVALVVAVLGVSLGFASFTNTLTIKSQAEVIPENNGKLNIDFAAASGFVGGEGSRAVNENMTTANVNASTGASVMKDASDNDILPSINNSAADKPVVENLTASFTAPGQSVTFNFYAANVGSYDGFLKSITFNPLTEGGSDLITCTARTGTTQSYVDVACENIKVSVQVQGETATQISVSSFDNHKLEVGNFETIQVVISYTGTAEADGAFDIAIGDIALVYSTIPEYLD